MVDVISMFSDIDMYVVISHPLNISSVDAGCSQYFLKYNEYLEHTAYITL